MHQDIMHQDFIQKISENTFQEYLTRFTDEFGQPLFEAKGEESEYFWETENFKFILKKREESHIYFYQIISYCDKSPLEFQHELRVKPDF